MLAVMTLLMWTASVLALKSVKMGMPVLKSVRRSVALLAKKLSLGPFLAVDIGNICHAI